MLSRTRSLILSLLLAVPAAVAAEADVSGKWTAETHMGAGGSESPVEAVFTFAVEGDELTGAVSSRRGEFEIQDGKIKDDTISFTVEVPGATILYDGLIQDDGIDFIAEFQGRGRSDHFVAKRLEE